MSYVEMSSGASGGENSIVLPFTYLNNCKDVSTESNTKIEQFFANWYISNLAVETTQAFSKEQNVDILQLNSSVRLERAITIEVTTNHLHHVAVIFYMDGSTAKIRIWTRDALSSGERIYAQFFIKRTA